MARDPHTGQYFKPKRRGQKFANRANQIAYNNQKQWKERQAMKYVENRLRKNRQILKRILGNRDSVVVKIDFLQGTGYDFRFTTHEVNYQNVQHYYVYEYLISHTSEDEVTISKVGYKHLRTNEQ